MNVDEIAVAKAMKKTIMTEDVDDDASEGETVRVSPSITTDPRTKMRRMTIMRMGPSNKLKVVVICSLFCYFPFFFLQLNILRPKVV